MIEIRVEVPKEPENHQLVLPNDIPTVLVRCSEGDIRIDVLPSPITQRDPRLWDSKARLILPHLPYLLETPTRYRACQMSMKLSSVSLPIEPRLTSTFGRRLQ